jgi:mannose-1-phosphate guanylyltransferase
LQKHMYRSEHWVVVEGTAEVTVGEKVERLMANEHAYIAAGEVHRIKNPSERDYLEIVEVQLGDILDETDIIRFSDEYGR